MNFDPIRQVAFRGKPLTALTHQETLEALVDALKQVRHLEVKYCGGAYPSFVPEEGPLRPMPYRPKSDFR